MFKITVNEQDEGVDRRYPYIGINDSGTMVLFIMECTGITLEKNDMFRAGYYSIGWVESIFKPFKGTVTIEQ